MIVDTMIYNGEADLLEIRLNVLAPVVDRFVLIESNQTFRGTPKPLHYREQKDRFAGFPIDDLAITYGEVPCNSMLPWETQENYRAWQREFGTRKMLGQHLVKLGIPAGSTVMYSDVDEIPNPVRVTEAAQKLDELHEQDPSKTYMFAFLQQMYYYWLDCRMKNLWTGTRMWRWNPEMTDLQAVRDAQGIAVPSGGWHFSYFGGVQKIKAKIHGGAHSELDRPEITDPEHIRECLDKGLDLFGRDEDNPLSFVDVADQGFPEWLVENMDRYRHLIAGKAMVTA